jgi:hypothetical protein
MLVHEFALRMQERESQKRGGADLTVELTDGSLMGGIAARLDIGRCLTDRSPAAGCLCFRQATRLREKQRTSYRTTM